MSSYKNTSDIILQFFSVDMRQVLLSHTSSWNMGFFVIFVNKLNGKVWGNAIIDSFICIFISTVQEMFHENCKNSKCHNFLIFYPIYIKSSLICLKMFALSFKFDLNVDQIPPLNTGYPSHVGPIHAGVHSHSTTVLLTSMHSPAWRHGLGSHVVGSAM